MKTRLHLKHLLKTGISLQFGCKKIYVINLQLICLSIHKPFYRAIQVLRENEAEKEEKALINALSFFSKKMCGCQQSHQFLNHWRSPSCPFKHHYSMDLSRTPLPYNHIPQYKEESLTYTNVKSCDLNDRKSRADRRNNHSIKHNTRYVDAWVYYK